MDCTPAVDSWFVDMDFESCLTEERGNKLATTMNSIPSMSSINSIEEFSDLLMMEEEDSYFYQDNVLGQQQPPAQQQQPPYNNNLKRRPNDGHHSSMANCFSSIAVPSTTPMILNFEKGNSSTSAALDNKTKKNKNDLLVTTSRDLNPEEEAFVSQVLRSSQDHSNNSNCNNDSGKINNNVFVKEKLTCVEVKKKRRRVRLPSENYDHIIAERKRREQIRQMLLALSTMVPGLTKMDKTSVLSDAIKYLKQLQDKVKTLEEQASKHTVESFVLVQKSKMMVLEEDAGDGENHGEETPMPAIEATLCNNKILIKIQSHKRMGFMAGLFRELENLKLSIVSTNAITFGSFADATIIAEITETDFDLTMKEVVKRLRAVV